MDAVYELLEEKPVRDLTMEAVAKRAKVGKPTLYKWWPTKSALIMAMFHERLAGKPVSSSAKTVEAALLAKMQRLVHDFNGLFGKVMADLIAEAQSDPSLLQELHDHICVRRTHTAADIERGKKAGEFLPDTDTELVVDLLFGPPYYRLLLGFLPLTQPYAEALIAQVLSGIKITKTKSQRRPKKS